MRLCKLLQGLFLDICGCCEGQGLQEEAALTVLPLPRTVPAPPRLTNGPQRKQNMNETNKKTKQNQNNASVLAGETEGWSMQENYGIFFLDN